MGTEPMEILLEAIAEAGLFYPVENDWGHCMTGPILRCRAVASTGHPENRGHHESL